MLDSPSTDSELLGAWLQSRDEKAFHVLVARYAVLVHQASRRLCGEDALAADASQATFVLLVRKARSLSGRPSLAGWLHVTAVLQTRNLLRQRRRESRKHELLRSHMDLSPQESPATAWTRLQPHLDEALSALSDSDRETLLLRFYRSLSVGEIGHALGIATAAAQKRLDRATERLRLQLARRGCTIGGELGSVMLAGFANDSHALIPSPAILAGKAITAGAASAGTLTTIGIIVMTKKAAIAGAAVLLIGVGAIAIATRNKDGASSATTGTTPAAASSRPSPGASLSPVDEAAEKSKVRKEREKSRDAEFVSQYGESRTNLSRKIVGDVVGLLEDAVAMGEMATSGKAAGAFGGPGQGLRRGLGGTYDKLALTDEQKDKANAVYTEFQKRQLEKTKGTIEDLKKSPESLMRLFLTGDAYKRGDMTETDFRQYQKDNAGELEKVINPLDRKNFQGGQPLRDPAFQTEMAGILDPTQAETFQAAVAEDTSKAATKDTDISNLPVMPLEKLDESITSAHKMTSGIKQMMEGMGGLQELGPLIEAQRKAKEAGGQ